MPRKKLGTYRPRAKQKWTDKYVFEMHDPCTHPAFVALCQSGDPDLTGWSEEVLDGAARLQEMTYGQIQDGADGCYFTLRDLRRVLPKNMPAKCAEVIALSAGYAPAIKGESVFYSLPHIGGPSRLVLTAPLLWQDAA